MASGQASDVEDADLKVLLYLIHNGFRTIREKIQKKIFRDFFYIIKKIFCDNHVIHSDTISWIALESLLSLNLTLDESDTLTDSVFHPILIKFVLIELICCSYPEPQHRPAWLSESEQCVHRRRCATQQRRD